jgi:hypothetical protein
MLASLWFWYLFCNWCHLINCGMFKLKERYEKSYDEMR